MNDLAKNEHKLFFDDYAGIKVCGVLRNPSGDNTQPIVMLAHGFSLSKASGTCTTLADTLGEHDISTFRIDFYGHGESEGEFENITISKAVTNILSAIDYLKTEGYTKIALVGSSFGGISSLLAASKTKDLYLLALKCPVSNYEEKELETKPKEELDEWRKKGFRYYTSGDSRKLKLNYSFYQDFENNDGYKEAPKISVPTLIIHGDADLIVPYHQSVKTCKLIPDCKLHTVKGASHHFSEPEHFDEMIKEITDFVVSNSK